MKTISTLLLFLIVATSTTAQNTDKEEYLVARIKPSGFGTTYWLYLDYSEAKGKDYIDPTDAVYDDSLGHRFRFKSESAVLNYLANQSWVILSVIPILSQGSSLETKYIFRRKVTGQRLPIIKPATVE